MCAKVLYVSHTPDLRGSAVSLYELVTHLDRSRFSPVVVFSKHGQLEAQLKAKGIRAEVLLRRGPFKWQLVLDSLRLIREEHIDLVHLNSAVPFCRTIGIAARFAGVPVIWHLREGPSDKRLRRLKKWITLLSQRIVVLTSEQEEFFAPNFKVVKIYNGVDLDRFNPELNGQLFRSQYGIPSDAFVFGMVGSIEPNKGQMRFLRAAASDVMRHDPRVHLLLVGAPTVDDELRTVMDFLREHPELAARTHLVGKQQDIPAVMAALDVLVVASERECFPRSIIEAMACGRPVVATGVGEIPRMIDDGISGYLVVKGDVEALARRLTDCAEQKENTKKMGLAARKKAEQFSMQTHIDAIQREYDALLH